MSFVERMFSVLADVIAVRLGAEKNGGKIIIFGDSSKQVT